MSWDTDQASFIAEWAPRIDAYLAGIAARRPGNDVCQRRVEVWRRPALSSPSPTRKAPKAGSLLPPDNAWVSGSSSWGSWEEAIDAHVAGLARGYGYTISVAGAKKYCPPNWFNWYNNTLSEMNRI